MNDVTDTPTGPLAVDILRDEPNAPAATTNAAVDTTGTDGKSATATPPPAFDAAAFGASFAKELAPLVAASSKAGAAAPTMTPEEARKLLKVWEPGDDWFAKFGNLDTQKAAVGEMRDALMQQFATFALAHAREQREQLLAEVHGKYGPVAERFSAAEAREQQTRFTTKYPALASPSLTPHIATIAQQLDASGALAGKSESEAFDILGKACETAFKAVNPAFSLSAAASASAQPTRKTNGNPNAQPTTSSGGGSAGGGGGNGASDSRPLAVRIMAGK